MIIGIDCSRAFVGEKTGTENYSYYLVKHLLRLPESSQHLFVLFTRPNAILPDWTKQKNVRIELIKFPLLWTQIGLAWRTWQIPLGTLWIPAHTLPMLRNPGVKTVVTIHGLEYQWLPEYKNWLQRWYLPLSTFYAAKAATQLIAVSEFTKQQLVKELHTSSKKIKVVHEGVEINKITNQYTNIPTENILEKYGLQDTEYVLFVGSVQPRKNLPALIAAFARFSRDYPSYQLVIAGGIGWMAAEALNTPLREGVQEKVIWTGRVSDEALAALYHNATLYIQPSITEGFGLPVLEAMGAGVPVITSDGGALPEVVGRAGIVVPLNSHFVDNLAREMTRVVAKESIARQMSDDGKKRVAQFGWDTAAKETLQVLVNV